MHEMIALIIRTSNFFSAVCVSNFFNLFSAVSFSAVCYTVLWRNRGGGGTSGREDSLSRRITLLSVLCE